MAVVKNACLQYMNPDGGVALWRRRCNAKLMHIQAEHVQASCCINLRALLSGMKIVPLVAQQSLAIQVQPYVCRASR